MSTFFIEFRDPLFGAILFFVIIFVIAIFSYWFSKYKKKEDYKHLDRFIKQFNAPVSKQELQLLITKGELSEKTWLLLAHSFIKNGDYEKAIEIYSELLKVGNKDNYRDTLFLLGKTYLRAGFLARSKAIFLEILQNNPRTPQALNYLLLVYEHMRDYSSAIEVLEPLEELQIETKIQRAYLDVKVILSSVEFSTEQKVEKLLEIYKKSNQLTYIIFEYIFRVDPKVAWINLDVSKSESLLDILWSCDKKDLNLDIIMSSGYLRELYSAKGYIETEKNSSIFELDVLINLNKSVSATLSFEYLCGSCKQISPFAFHRCSSCHAIDSLVVEFSLTKSYYGDFSEENNSFQ